MERVPILDIGKRALNLPMCVVDAKEMISCSGMKKYLAVWMIKKHIAIAAVNKSRHEKR